MKNKSTIDSFQQQMGETLSKIALRRILRISYVTCVVIMFAGFLLTMLISFNYLFHTEQKFLFSLLIGVAGLGIVCCAGQIVVVIKLIGVQDYVEKTLKESWERYRSVIAASNTGAWEYHTDTSYLWASCEYFRMLGYEEKDFLKEGNLDINDVWIGLLHPDDRDRVTQKFTSYITKGSSEFYENHFRLRHKQGNYVWIWSRAQALRNTNGSISKVMLGTHIDVTERMNLEIELIKHNEKLIKYAHLNAHEVRGPLARLLGLIEVAKLDSDLNYPWIFGKIKNEANGIDNILKLITKELNEIEEHKYTYR